MPFPSPEDLPYPGIKPGSLALQADSLPSELPGKPVYGTVTVNKLSILKRRDITLSTTLHLVKAMVFPIVMYGCESWTVKKAEHRRIDDFFCGVGFGEDSCKFLGLQGDPTSPS